MVPWTVINSWNFGLYHNKPWQKSFTMQSASLNNKVFAWFISAKVAIRSPAFYLRLGHTCLSISVIQWIWEISWTAPFICQPVLLIIMIIAFLAVKYQIYLFVITDILSIFSQQNGVLKTCRMCQFNLSVTYAVFDVIVIPMWLFAVTLLLILGIWKFTRYFLLDLT